MDLFTNGTRTYLMGDLKGELAREPEVTLLPARCEALPARAGCATRGMVADAVVVGEGELCTKESGGSPVFESIVSRRF